MRDIADIEKDFKDHVADYTNYELAGGLQTIKWAKPGTSNCMESTLR